MQTPKPVTLEQVLEAVDELCPNSFSREEKVRWLTSLDGKIYEEILRIHEDPPSAFLPYDPHVGSRELLVPAPYAMELYMAFLENTMDHYNGDTARYNNSLDRFAAQYNSFFRWYHSHRRPKGGNRKFW